MKESILVIGAARSGLAAADLALHHGHTVRITDDRPPDGELLRSLEDRGVRFAKPGELTRDARLVIPSPAVPPEHPLLLQAAGRGVPVCSEVDFARRYFQGRVIGITGSNGKTTTTMLTAQILRAAGRDARACGNVGYPFSRCVLEHPETDWVALELSSYQLEFSSALALEAGILLNLSVDHLERHGSMENYLGAKMRMAGQLASGGRLVYNLDDPAVAAAVQGSGRPSAAFSLAREAEIHLDGETLRFPAAETSEFLRRGEPRLRGDHNLQNIMAAALAAHCAGVDAETVRGACLEFEPVEHRIETVRRLDEVEWVNDSKATNEDSTRAALLCYEPGSVILLAGGIAKSKEFTAVEETLVNRVRELVVFGRDGGRIADFFRGRLPVHETETLEQAVIRARSLARPGDTALFSPLCASFDQFRDYEHRGAEFKRLVRELK